MSQERLLKVIISPYMSEKASVCLEKKNEYVFKVGSFASTPEIKDAVEMLFNVKVKDVRVLNTNAKTKTFKGKEGKRKAWKKAYVTLQSDQKLDMSGSAIN